MPESNLYLLRLGAELAGLNTLRAAHGEQAFLDAPGRAVAFCRWRAADARAILAAGAGIAKHGNRAASSASGAADVLEALGFRLELPPELIERSIDELGFGFLFAQAHHPAMRHAAPVRRRAHRRRILDRQHMAPGHARPAARRAHASVRDRTGWPPPAPARSAAPAGAGGRTRSGTGLTYPRPSCCRAPHRPLLRLAPPPARRRGRRPPRRPRGLRRLGGGGGPPGGGRRGGGGGAGVLGGRPPPAGPGHAR